MGQFPEPVMLAANHPMSNSSCRRRAFCRTLDGVQLITLDARDNIAIATADLHVGEVMTLGTASITIRSEVPRGHKVALKHLASGSDVIRYGEIIGATTKDVAIGEHVHVHNLISKRLPG